MCSSANAASFGHSRIVSALGQPLHVNVPVTQLSADELRTLAVAPAPLSAWRQAGLIPPVDLAALKLDIVDGYTPGTRVISLRSTETFDRPVVDLLLDVSTSSGRQRYQVSLLAQAPYGATSTQRSSDPRGQPADAAGQRAPAKTIRVRQGDTMFAIARRNAVRGVTIYQMMIALQRANPHAFIHDNVNLVKAGATLRMPDKAALTAISDREARRIFQQHAQAFALYRQRAAASVATVGQEGGAASGVVSAGPKPVPEEPLPGPQDQLRLSGSAAASGANGSGGSVGGANAAGGSSSAGTAAGTATDRADVKADDSVAARKGVQESEKRVSQLEENVKHLNEALRSQGGAASDLIVEGAKGLGQSLSDAASVVTGKPSASGASGSIQDGAAGAPPASSSGSETGNASAGQAGPDGSADSSAAAGGSGSNAASANAKPGMAAPIGAPNGGTAATQGTQATPATPANGGNAAPAASTSGTPAGGNDGAGGSPANAAADSASGSAANGVDGTKGKVQSEPQSAADAGGSSAGANGPAAAPGAANGQGASPTEPGASSQASGSSPSASTPAPASGSGTSASPSAAPGSSAASGANGPASAGEPSSTNKAGASESAQGAGQGISETSTKAEQIVSWLQEHMLGVITGVLALIVLIIAWLLRRANTARDDGRDDSAGLITEAMVKEKLDQINLDLEQQVPDDARSRRG